MTPAFPPPLQEAIAQGKTFQARANDTAPADLPFSGGKAERLDLYQVNLDGADLADAYLVGVLFTNARLRETSLKGAWLQRADLRGADLRGADLQGANFTGASLNRSDIRGADLRGAVLDETLLTVALYDQETQWPEGFNHRRCGAIGPRAQLGGAYLHTVNCRGADLSGANFLGAYLSGADFTGANLADAAFSSADLRRASFTGAYLVNARFNSAQLDQVDFRGADLTGVQMENPQGITGADFYRVQGLPENLRATLLGRSPDELDVWNGFTRRSTRDSLVDNS
ncbi:MAG: pentapeptide repeat-containing protein [Cyanophyceae cyanobacterium]